MVVLLRAFTHLDAYEDSLERAGLRPYVVGGRGYWSQQQVADVCALLATIANPLDDQALFGALASPACGGSARHALAARAPAAAAAAPRLAGARARSPALRARPSSTTPRARSSRSRRSELALLRGFARPSSGLRERAPRLPLAEPDRRGGGRDRLRPGRADAPGGRGALRQRAQADAPRRRVRGARGPRPARPARLPRLPRRRRCRGPGRDRGRGTRRGADHDRPQRQGARVRRGRRARPLAAPAGRIAGAAADDRPRRRGAAGGDAAAPPRGRLDQPLRPPRALRGGPATRRRGGAAPLPRRGDAGARAADPQRRRRGRSRDATTGPGRAVDRAASSTASRSTASATRRSTDPGARSRARGWMPSFAPSEIAVRVSLALAERAAELDRDAARATPVRPKPGEAPRRCSSAVRRRSRTGRSPTPRSPPTRSAPTASTSNASSSSANPFALCPA